MALNRVKSLFKLTLHFRLILIGTIERAQTSCAYLFLACFVNLWQHFLNRTMWDKWGLQYSCSEWVCECVCVKGGNNNKFQPLIINMTRNTWCHWSPKAVRDSCNILAGGFHSYWQSLCSKQNDLGGSLPRGGGGRGVMCNTNPSGRHTSFSLDHRWRLSLQPQKTHFGNSCSVQLFCVDSLEFCSGIKIY